MTRTPYWLIQGGILIDWLAIPVALVFGYGCFRHWRKITRGTIRLRFSIARLPLSLQGFQWSCLIKNGILGLRIFRKPVTGLFHGLVITGMLLLFSGTLLVLLHLLFGLPVFQGSFSQWFMAFTLDLAGLLVTVAVLFLLIRRLSGYQRLVTPETRKGFIAAELLLLGVVWTGFAVEALRLQLGGGQEIAFIGNALAGAVNGFSGLRATYIGLWWSHGLLALGFIAYIPFSPLAHLLFVPVNTALNEPLMGADDKVIDAVALAAEPQDALPVLGTPRLADFSSRRLLDISTCLWCGRCHEVCPASATAKSLSPKGIMTTLAGWLRQNKTDDAGLIDSIGMETLFECRTCGACVEACPALVNPLKTIMGMRQSLMMERGDMPSAMRQAYRNFDTFMHPFTSSASPADWHRGLDVPPFTAGQSEYLLWVGCAVTYEDRAQQIGRAMVRILNASGISYGIIEEARCTGDPAKQMGDDYLFSMLAGANIQLFTTHGVRKIITLCPHCYNSFRNYYPPLGGRYDIIPHVELINDLIAAGRLKINHGGTVFTYHDPCYLGRHNRILQGPRKVLEALGRLSEMDRRGSESFCCGGGGGNYWNEEQGERINYIRAKEAFARGADQTACACPFCLLMLTDGMKMYTDRHVVFDIAELVVQNLVD